MRLYKRGFYFMYSIYIFLYSDYFNEFESELMEINKVVNEYNKLSLRCRFNTQRNINIYSTQLSDFEAESFNLILKENGLYKKQYNDFLFEEYLLFKSLRCLLQL